MLAPSPTWQPKATPTPTLSSGVSAGLVAGVSIFVAAAAAALIVMHLCLRKDKRPDVEALKGHPYGPQHKNWQSQSSSTSPPQSSPILTSRGSSGLNYSESENSLAPAPSSIPMGFSHSNFSFEELSISNGLGYVHRGVNSNGSEQGESELFQGEVEKISTVHQEFQRFPVLEFVPNNKLEFHLHGNSNIIEREIKAPNLPLDQKLESKVVDLGLIKLSSNVNTHFSTGVKGAIGFGASKYTSSGCLEAYKRLNWTKFQPHYIAWAYKIQAQNHPKTQSPNFIFRKQWNYPNLPSAFTISTASAGAFPQKPPINFRPPQTPPRLQEFLRKNLPDFFCRHDLHHLRRLHRKAYPKIMRRHEPHRLRRGSSISAIPLRPNHDVNPKRNSAAMARALRFVRVLPPSNFLRL